MQNRQPKQLTPEEEKERQIKNALKDYLVQYNRSRMRKRQLEMRLKNIINEMKMPIGGVGYSPTPRSNTNVISVGSASFTLKMSEIEDRIEEERDNMALNMIKVMDLIDFLDEGAMERRVIEYRYIDGLPWEKIERQEHMTRQSCNNYMNAGLNKLLQFKKVKVLIEEYMEENDL